MQGVQKGLTSLDHRDMRSGRNQSAIMKGLIEV